MYVTSEKDANLTWTQRKNAGKVRRETRLKAHHFTRNTMFSKDDQPLLALDLNKFLSREKPPHTFDLSDQLAFNIIKKVFDNYAHDRQMLITTIQCIMAECEYRLRKGEDSGDRSTLNTCRQAMSSLKGLDHLGIPPRSA